MTDLTLAMVRDRVGEVIVMDEGGGDPEAAHSLQDDLYVDVLKAVAASHPDAVQMATEALRIEAVDGTRWYA